MKTTQNTLETTDESEAVFKFSELSDKAKRRAIKNNYDWNVDHTRFLNPKK
jgi:heme oxygenase